MKNLKQIVFIILLTSLCCLFSSCSLIKKWQAKRIANLEDMISSLEEEMIPMKFKILEKNGIETTIEIKFIDLNGETTKEEKMVLSGNEVHFDFQVIKLEAKDKKEAVHMFYPYKIYTDMIPPEDGIDLYNLYNESGFPTIYNGFDKSLSLNNQESIKEQNAIDRFLAVLSKPEDNEQIVKAFYEKIEQTFDYIKSGELEKLSNQYGSAVHDMQGISNFKKGYIYSIVCHPARGGIEIVRY